MNDCNIIKYNINTFNDIMKLYCDDNISDVLLEKIKFLKDNFTCFNTPHDSKKIFEKKKFNKKDFKTPKNKVHIIMHEFDNDTVNKRHLIGYLNKLTIKNKEQLYPKIKEVINKNNNIEFINTVIAYIKSYGNELYINILDFFDENIKNKYLKDIWCSYIQNKEWIPPRYILEYDILHLENEYDMYCNYKKWKNEITNMNKLWMFLKKDIDGLLNDIYEFFEKYLKKHEDIGEYIEIENYTVYKHVLDLLLEQICNILYFHKNENIIKNIEKLDVKLFENSTKFSIYNILDKK